MKETEKEKRSKQEEWKLQDKRDENIPGHYSLITLRYADSGVLTGLFPLLGSCGAA